MRLRSSVLFAVSFQGALCALDQKVLDHGIRFPSVSVDKIDYPKGDGGCSAEKTTLLKVELDKAKAMLKKTHEVISPTSRILEDFLIEDWRNTVQINPFKGALKMIMDCIDGTTVPVEVKITCNEKADYCKEIGAVAYTDKDATINLCQGFWKLKKSAEVENPHDTNQKLGDYDSQGLRTSFFTHFLLDFFVRNEHV